MKQTYLLGGYTKRLNHGIHEVSFNPEKGKFEESKLIFELENPTYLCTSADQDYLFSLIQDKDQAGVIAFTKVKDRWQEVDRCYGAKVNGCHITYRNVSQSLYVSNYHEGCIDVYSFIDQKLDHIQNIRLKDNNAGPYQANAKMHYIGFKETENLLFACNLGQDLMITFDIDKAGRLSKKFEFPTQDKMGPRHFVFHPTLPIMYVNGELNNSVATLKIDPEGKLSEINTVECLPEDLVEGAKGAAIKITSDGKFLYTSTRYSNFISVFEIDDQGRLERIQHIDSIGQIPRDFTLDQGEDYLLVPHQESDYISVFKRDKTTGLLKFINNETEQPETICILPFSNQQ